MARTLPIQGILVYQNTGSAIRQYEHSLSIRPMKTLLVYNFLERNIALHNTNTMFDSLKELASIFNDRWSHYHVRTNDMMLGGIQASWERGSA